MKDRRTEERIDMELSGFISAEIVIEKGFEEAKTLNLKVVNRSKHGLGLLVTKNDFKALKVLKPGNRIKNLMLYAPQALLKINAEIRHVTKIKDGPCKGLYVLGVKSEEIINPHKQN